ncbi:MAG: hypothetical protein A2V98_25070 [Planctomycetes bacterium RBG_16_64_12]|nr:MAG: hypothetical protein A2V98_25070 [Planctomycetes bacterium RBG_16_64_12]
MFAHLPKWTGALAILASSLAICISKECRAQAPLQECTLRISDELEPRVERALDRWCRWLAGYLRQVPGTDLYTMTPTLGTNVNRYRDVAGNQFAAAAAGYWLSRAEPEEEIARPLGGLIKLSLASHVAVAAIDRPEAPKWGAGHSAADNWHADLFAATSGMLMLEGLRPPERDWLLAILAWEADKQVEYGIRKESHSLPGRWPDHSIGEANAWSTALVQTARLALPDSQRQSAWRNTAIDYSLNAICVPDDMTSERIVAGRPLKDRVKGANFEPGGIQEHHGFYHPGYMGWPLAYQAYAMLIDETLPPEQRDPDVYLHHWKLAYDRLKQGTFANGRFIYCAGYDWNAYGYGNAHILPIAIFAAVRFQDPDASRLAREWLSLVEQEQALSDGSIQGVRLARLKRNYINDFAWYEGISGASLAHALWVLKHVDARKMPPPSTEEEYNARTSGTYHEPNARLVWHRDAKRWASFCWRSAFGEWQAIVQPIALPHLLKFNHNSMGILDAAGTTGKAAIRSFAIDTFDQGGFWSLGTIDRLSPETKEGFPLVRQHQALVVLPEGPSVFVDQCQALAPLELRRTGGLGLRLAADVFNNSRVNLTVKGSEETFAQHPEHDTWHDLDARSVTIENTMTLDAISGEGSFELLQKRRRPPEGNEKLYPGDTFAVEESLVSHELYFGPPAYEPPRRIQPEEWFRNLVVVIYCDPEKTPDQPSATVVGRHPCLAIHLADAHATIAINFADTEQATDSPVGRITVGPRSVRLAH